MGQFRSQDRCPLCETPHPDGSNENWTCPSCKILVDVHRGLIRNLQSWRSLYESLEVPDVLISNDLREYSLWDVQKFYAHRTVLADRQHQAIQFCLFENMKEREASMRMGISAASPCSIYATIGLTLLLNRAVSGRLPGYFIELSTYDPPPVTTVIEIAPTIVVAALADEFNKEIPA